MFLLFFEGGAIWTKKGLLDLPIKIQILFDQRLLQFEASKLKLIHKVLF